MLLTLFNAVLRLVAAPSYADVGRDHNNVVSHDGDDDDTLFQDEENGEQQQLPPLSIDEYNNSRRGSPESMVKDLSRRFCIFITGCGLAGAMFLPSIMISDSGTASAMSSTQTAMLACVLWALGGILGAILDGYVINGWWCLLPGLFGMAWALATM